MQKTWGRWTFNPKNACLEIEAGAGGSLYQTPMDKIDNSARILDWVFQLEEKTWISPQDLKDFVRAIAYIFGRGVASGGKDHPINPKAILKTKYGCAF